MPDYSKGKIYKILNNIDDNVYVGSTVKTLSQRMAQHRSATKIKQHNKLYKHINELGVENFYIELIENYSCNDVYELRAREGHFIREIATLNNCIAGRTQKEYLETHKEEKQLYDNKYRAEHIEKKKLYDKQYNENNKEYIKEYKKKYRAEHIEEKKLYDKQYAETHKEEIKAYEKKWREEHKEEIKAYEKERNKIKTICPNCNSEVCKKNLTAHQRTKKCKLIAESKNKQILR